MQRLAIPAVTTALAIAYLLGVLATTEPGGSFLQGDARAYFAYLPSLVIDGDLDLRNQFAMLQPEGETAYPFGRTRDGRAHNPFPIAPAIMWLPGYLAGVAIDRAMGASADPPGYGRGAVLATAIWSILLAGAGAELTRRLAASIVDARAALAATLMAWLGTSALYYTIVSPLYSHAPAWAAVSLMVWLTWRATRMTGAPALAWACAGAAAGWVVAVRLQDLPLLLVPIGGLVTQLRGRRAGSSALFAWAGAAVLGYLVQAATWYSFDGTLVPFGEDPLSTPTFSNLLGVLFSTGYRGWISWTPLVLGGIAGLVLLAGGDRGSSSWIAGSALAGIAGMVLLDVMHPFGAGASYGGRRYVSATPLIAVGLAGLLQCGGSGSIGRMTSAGRMTRRALAVLTAANLWVLFAYEMLILRHGVYPSLAETLRYAAGFGPP